MKFSSIIFCVISMLFFSSINAEEKIQKRTIQIAILLDTSNSMDGLIHQAKTQLWNIVNELATAKKNGQIPELQVGLYEYGNDSLSSENGYIRRVLPLTTDLDKISEELFALKTNGGSEYCGWVINKAIKELKWSNSNHDFKAIYIAGNESFNQSSSPSFRNNQRLNRFIKKRVNSKQKIQQQQQQINAPNINKKNPNKTNKNKERDYRISCKLAISKGIIINTIHCGDYQTGINGQWRDGATLADGIYINIDQNRKVIDIKSPQDKEILEWNQKLNTTYLPYGSKGKEGKMRQRKQDGLAKENSYSGNIQRVVSKSSYHYRNASWDLLDAHREGKVDLSEIKEENLPKEMQNLTAEQRKEYLAKLLKKRQEIQKKIQELMSTRKKYVAEKMREKTNDKDTLETAITKTLRKQLLNKDYSFEKK